MQKQQLSSTDWNLRVRLLAGLALAGVLTLNHNYAAAIAKFAFQGTSPVVNAAFLGFSQFALVGCFTSWTLQALPPLSRSELLLLVLAGSALWVGGLTVYLWFWLFTGTPVTMEEALTSARYLAILHGTAVMVGRGLVFWSVTLNPTEVAQQDQRSRAKTLAVTYTMPPIAALFFTIFDLPKKTPAEPESLTRVVAAEILLTMVGLLFIITSFSRDAPPPPPPAKVIAQTRWIRILIRFAGDVCLGFSGFTALALIDSFMSQRNFLLLDIQVCTVVALCGAVAGALGAVFCSPQLFDNNQLPRAARILVAAFPATLTVVLGTWAIIESTAGFDVIATFAFFTGFAFYASFCAAMAVSSTHIFVTALFLGSCGVPVTIQACTTAGAIQFALVLPILAGIAGGNTLCRLVDVVFTD